MSQRFEDEGKQMAKEALVQTFKGENLFLLSDLLVFYMELGCEIRNVRKATQYLGEHCMAKFINKVVQMRIEATDEGDETRANTAKIIANSSYGKLLQNPEKYKRCVLVDDENLFYYIRKPNMESRNLLETEAGNILYIIFYILYFIYYILYIIFYILYFIFYILYIIFYIF